MTDTLNAPALPKPSASEAQLDNVFATLRYVLGVAARSCSPSDHLRDLVNEVASWPLVRADAIKSAASVRAREISAHALATLTSAPAGWQLVPEEPTPEMMQAAFAAYTAPLDGSAVRIIAAHKAMLSAAPSSPHTADGGRG